MSRLPFAVVPADLVFAIAARAQPGAIPTPVAAPIDAFQAGYAANLNSGDSVVQHYQHWRPKHAGGFTTTGNIG